MRTLEDALKSNEEQPEDKTANAERLKVSGSTDRSNGVQDSSEEFDVPDGNDVEGSHNLAQVISGYRTVPKKFFSQITIRFLVFPSVCWALYPINLYLEIPSNLNKKYPDNISVRVFASD